MPVRSGRQEELQVRLLADLSIWDVDRCAALRLTVIFSSPSFCQARRSSGSGCGWSSCGGTPTSSRRASDGGWRKMTAPASWNASRILRRRSTRWARRRSDVEASDQGGAEGRRVHPLCSECVGTVLGSYAEQGENRPGQHCLLELQADPRNAGNEQCQSDTV